MSHFDYDYEHEHEHERGGDEVREDRMGLFSRNLP